MVAASDAAVADIAAGPWSVCDRAHDARAHKLADLLSKAVRPQDMCCRQSDGDEEAESASDPGM